MTGIRPTHSRLHSSRRHLCLVGPSLGRGISAEPSVSRATSSTARIRCAALGCGSGSTDLQRYLGSATIFLQFVAAVTLHALGMDIPAAHSQYEPNAILPPGVHEAPPMIVLSGNAIGPSTVVNVLEGSTVGSMVHVGLPDGSSQDSVMNILGGTVRGALRAHHGSVVNLIDGEVGRKLHAHDGGIVNVFGGTIDSEVLLDSGARLNIMGGEAASSATAGHRRAATVVDAGIISIAGGSLGDQAFVGEGGSLQLLSGSVGDELTVWEGGSTKVFGGTIGRRFSASEGSSVSLFGGEFLLNGNKLPTNVITLTEADVLTGVLSDGSTFALTPLAGDGVAGVHLVDVPLPAIEQHQVVVDEGVLSTGLRTGQTLALLEGGSLAKNFAVVDASLNVLGGEIGDGLELARSTLNMSTGAIGRDATAYGGSVLNVRGGSFHGHLFARDNSIVNITGGEFAGGINVDSGSVMNISDGDFGSIRFSDGGVGNIAGGIGGISVVAGGVVNVAGGSFGRASRAEHGGVFNIYGGEFLLNGVSIEPGAVEVNSAPRDVGIADVLTGTLQDGSPFVLSPQLRDQTYTFNLIATTLPDAAATPQFVDSDTAPHGLRKGQALTLVDGGLLPRSFAVIDAKLEVNGGQVGPGLAVVRGELSMDAGIIDDVAAFEQSVVNMAGGIAGDLGVHADSNVSISGGAFEHLAVYPGGKAILLGRAVGNSVDVASGGEFNMSGGTIANEIVASSRSRVSITGGQIGEELRVLTGSQVHVSGGRIGRVHTFLWDNEVDFSLFGGEFTLNGEMISDERLALAETDVLTGTLEDGSVIVFSPYADDVVDDVQLVTTATPPLRTEPLSEADVEATLGLRPGHDLSVRNGKSLGDHFASVGAKLRLFDGSAGKALEVVDSEVLIAGGRVGEDFRAYSGSVVTIADGIIGSSFRALPGSVVNVEGGTIDHRFSVEGAAYISGGTIGQIFHAREGSVVEITGGDFEGRVVLEEGSRVNVSGGSFGHAHGALTQRRDSVLNLFGGEFRMDGQPVDGVALNGLQGGSVFTGTLADGSPFVFSGPESIRELTLTTVDLPPARTAAATVLSTADSPKGLRQGESLTLVDGGELKQNFAAVGATLDIEGGLVGDGMEAAYSNVSISGGAVGNFLAADKGSVVTISGGTVGVLASARPGSVVNLNGGNVGQAFTAWSGSDVNISGGRVEGFLRVASEGRVDFYGGDIGENVQVRSQGEVNVYGKGFILGGVPILDLQPGERRTIDARDVVLSGILADGSAFDLRLNSRLSHENTEYFLPGSLLTVTLVSDLSGDFDFDFGVDGADFLDWQRGNSTISRSDSDLAQWESNFGVFARPSVKTPEPATVSLLGIMLLARYWRRLVRRQANVSRGT